MKIVKPESKDHVIYFLQANISLGTYDKRFLNNLETINLVNKKPLTSNQVILLDKIIKRYKRQIEKLEVSIDDLLTLPWITQPIQSSPQFTEVHLLIVDDSLVLRSPYKKDFVSEFRKLEINPLWHAEDRFWTIQVSTHNLKVIKEVLEKHYNKINYCDTITKLVDGLNVYDGYKYWDPTLVCRNDNLFIYGINPSLYEAMENFDINMNLATLNVVRKYGIEIDESALNKFRELYSADEVEFAVNPTPMIEYDNPTIAQNIKSINADFVLLLERNSTSKYFEILKENLTKQNISWETYKGLAVADIKNKHNTVVVAFGTDYKHINTTAIHKMVTLVNSKPIKLA